MSTRPLESLRGSCEANRTVFQLSTGRSRRQRSAPASPWRRAQVGRGHLREEPHELPSGRASILKKGLECTTSRP